MFGLKSGIIVNDDFGRYDIVREDNGRLIETVTQYQEPFQVIFELHKIQKKYKLKIINLDRICLQLEHELHPVSAWRPRKSRGIFRELREMWWETGNIAKTIKHKRGDM